MSSGAPAIPIADVLSDLSIPALPEGCTARGLFALIKLEEPDGGIGWAVRVTPDVDDEELLGVLVGYVEHLKRVAADSWTDFETTRAE